MKVELGEDAGGCAVAARTRLPPGIYVDPYELATLQQHNLTKVMAPVPGDLAATQMRTQGVVLPGHYLARCTKVINSWKEVPNRILFLMSPCSSARSASPGPVLLIFSHTGDVPGSCCSSLSPRRAGVVEGSQVEKVEGKPPKRCW